MVKITYIEFTGAEHVVDVEEGLTVMEGARDNDIPGIEADCGGACACATCHCYVNENWISKLSPADDDEESMLDQAFDVQKNSRLSCQIPFTEELDGVVLTLAPK